MPTSLPLSFQQQWLWSLMQQHVQWKCTVAYGMRLTGPLSLALLRNSLEAVIRRHGSLRTRIVTGDEEVRQEVDEPNSCSLDAIPVPGDSEAQIQASAWRMFEEFSGLERDPAVGPLMSLRLLRLSSQEHWLLLNVHRVIADCYGVDVMIRDLWSAYSPGVRRSSETSPGQYSDYALRQRESHPQWRMRHEAYWKQRLEDAIPVQWPLQPRSQSASQGALGQMSCRLGGVLNQELRSLAKSARTLAPSVMLAVYVAVLWRWTGQKDFVVPFNVAGRQSEHTSMVGFFSHILYLRIQLTGSETFKELLGRVTQELYRGLTHQDFGIMATRMPELSAGTFFQWITWHPHETLTMPASDGQSAALRVERISVAEFGEGLTAIPPGRVAVEVTFFDTPDGIYASGVYRADLFTPATMERFMADLRSTAEELVGDPSSPITAAVLNLAG